MMKNHRAETLGRTMVPGSEGMAHGRAYMVAIMAFSSFER